MPAYLCDNINQFDVSLWQYLALKPPVKIIYIFFLIFLLSQFLYLYNMLKIKCDINQQDFKIVDLHFANSESFSLTWVVDRVSETQRQVSKHSDKITWLSKGSGIRDYMTFSTTIKPY